MALFQPTNITPSTFGELGGGTVDIAEGLTVSWQINGTSAMTKFAIAVYKNDAASTEVYNTGELTEGCPCYGTDYQGNPVFFSYEIGAAALADAGMVNGADYKLVITQWWSDTESVVQTSASAFITRAAPSLAIADIPDPLTYRAYTFSAAYSQAQGDAIMWFRWYISQAGDLENFLLDTGNVYGTGDVRVFYDGFFTGNYMIRCIAETVNGIQADTGWIVFSVSYAESALTGLLTGRSCAGGIYLKWPLVQYIPGTGSGDYSLEDGKLILGSGGSVTWNTSNGGALSLAAPWTFVWSGAMAQGTPFTLSGGGHTLSFTMDGDSMDLTLDGTVLYSHSYTPSQELNEWVVAVTPTEIGIRLNQPYAGLYPSPTLYPSETLYPKPSQVFTYIYREALAYAQFTLSSITVNGEQTCDYLWSFPGSPTEALWTQLMETEGYMPERETDTYFLTNFAEGLNAGNLGGGATAPTGIAIYRQEQGKTALEPVVVLPLQTTEMIDFGARNQVAYTYYLFPATDTLFVAEPIISETITPLCWDWLLISAEADSNGVFHMTGRYPFGLNVQSGSLSNNNSPSILETFTAYPLIQRKSANFLSGTLTAYIGTVKDGAYADTREQREAIMALSVTEDDLFLKSRKGDFLRVSISGAIAVTTLDGSAQQAQSMALPWAQTATTDGVSLICTPADPAWPLG